MNLSLLVLKQLWYDFANADIKSQRCPANFKNPWFFEVRTKGSHIFLKHSDGRATLVPRHGSEDIGRGLLRQILREINIPPEEFSKLL